MAQDISKWKRRNRLLLVSILDDLNSSLPDHLEGATKGFRVTIRIDDGHQKAFIEYPPPVSCLEVKE